MDKKIGRTSVLLHKKTGSKVETPLLIPSFSSKGFRIKNGKSEVQKILEISSEYLTLPYLVSAFDIHHGHLPKAEDLPRQPLIILDSGGYEVSDDRDLSDVNQPIAAREPWNPALLKQTLDKWPAHLPTAIVNYDHPKERHPVMRQIELARELFRGREHLHSFLLKPENDDQYTLQEALRWIYANVEELSAFDIIGVAEKELGSSMLDRMAAISRLRQSLDYAGIGAPMGVIRPRPWRAHSRR